MSNKIIIAIDAMGGDDSPHKIIKGISIHSKTTDNVYYKIFGNKKLIDLTETPQDLRKEIINTFIEQDVWSNKFKTFNYLVTKRCNNLIDSVQEFIE